LEEASFVLENDEKKAEEKIATEVLTESKKITKNIILSDNTYTTQTVLLRKLIVSGNELIDNVISSA
jgi:hypothetical protein